MPFNFNKTKAKKKKKKKKIKKITSNVLLYGQGVLSSTKNFPGGALFFMKLSWYPSTPPAHNLLHLLLFNPHAQ
jgi:hypothetical protein